MALDANLPERLVSLLRAAFNDLGYEFMWEPDFAPANAQDEFWLDAFRRFGGEIVLSADKNIARRPHQLLAFREAKLKGFFFNRNWANHHGWYKVAHLMLWFPRIAALAKASRPGDCYWVPAQLQAKDFKPVNFAHIVQSSARNPQPRKRATHNGQE
ncbi:MAG: hypothetical protein GC189_11365 [Alphaproteobacteria bacterium]|nr:hypothetical protein [Alphaproteobacteria bacterium]